MDGWSHRACCRAGAIAAMLLSACALGTPPGADAYGQPQAAPPDIAGIAGNGNAAAPPSPTPSSDSAPAGVCPPRAGNEIGVGRRCTKGGGQCNQVTAQFCSADYTSLPIWFCTTLCDGTTNCGTNARCAPNPQRPDFFVCLPESCVIVDPPANIPPISNCFPKPPGPKGVGTPCTAGGGECRALTAGLCTTDALPSAPFALCTLACNNDADCETGNRCIPAPGGLGIQICVPSACLP